MIKATIKLEVHNITIVVEGYLEIGWGLPEGTVEELTKKQLDMLQEAVLAQSPIPMHMTPTKMESDIGCLPIEVQPYLYTKKKSPALDDLPIELDIKDPSGGVKKVMLHTTDKSNLLMKKEASFGVAHATHQANPYPSLMQVPKNFPGVTFSVGGNFASAEPIYYGASAPFMSYAVSAEEAQHKKEEWDQYMGSLLGESLDKKMDKLTPISTKSDSVEKLGEAFNKLGVSFSDVKDSMGALEDAIAKSMVEKLEDAIDDEIVNQGPSHGLIKKYQELPKPVHSLKNLLKKVNPSWEDDYDMDGS